jgi:hypothetical protein
MHCVGLIKEEEEEGWRTESVGCLVVCCLVNLTKMADCVKKCSVAHKYSASCLYTVKEFYFFLSTNFRLINGGNRHQKPCYYLFSEKM